MQRLLRTKLCWVALAVLTGTVNLWAADATSSKPSGATAAAASTAKVDHGTLERALELYEARKFSEAEKLFHEVLAASDAGQLPQADAGRCLGPLTTIYQTWGRKDNEALDIAWKYHKYITEKLADDPVSRDQILDGNSAYVVDILLALDRSVDAEKLQLNMLAAAEKHTEANPQRTLKWLWKLAQFYQLEENVPLAKRYGDRTVELALAVSKKLEQNRLPPDPECVAALAAGYAAAGNKAEAIHAFTDLLKLQSARHESLGAVQTQLTLGSLCADAGQFDEALTVFQNALAAQRQIESPAPQEGELLSRMAAVNSAKGAAVDARHNWEDAAAVYTQILERIQLHPQAQTQQMAVLDHLQKVLQQAGNYTQAIQACRQLLELRKKTFGEQHPLTIAAKSDLGALYGVTGNYDLALPLLTDALAFWQNHTPPEKLKLARALNDLAVVERGVGSFNEAQTLLEKALELRQKGLTPDDQRLASSYANLASIYHAKGLYAKAVTLFDQAIDIYKAHGVANDDALSGALLMLAMVYKSQGELPQAVDKTREALQVYQRVFGDDAPGAVEYYNALTSLYIRQKQLVPATDYNQKAWQLCQRYQFDVNHEPIAAETLHNKALIEYLLTHFDDAQRDWQAALKIQLAAGQTEQVARSRNFLADIAAERGQTADAEKLYRSALALQGNAHAYPIEFYLTSCQLANIDHEKGNTKEALALVEEAVNVLETPRAGTIGAESQRASYFADFASAFDLLVSWNLELGRVSEAFEAAERGRNRTFLDQLNLAGVDLRDTLTGPAGEKLREREKALRGKLGTLKAQVQAASQSITAGEKGDTTPLDKITAEIDAAQKEYAQVMTDIRNANPLYREQLTQNSGKFDSLAVVRQALAKLHSVMLFYYIGDKKSYLLVIDPADENVQALPLEIPPALAKALLVKEGPIGRSTMVQLVNQYLADVRDRAGGRGLGGVVHSEKGVMAADQGTLLAEVLVPRSVRNVVEHRAPQSVIIVPDGALDELPFEALLLENEPSPKYLFDVFPPIAYAPSADILMNLIDRPAPDAGATGILTVGNPKYPEASGHSLAAISRAAYLGLGGALPPLPATASECQRVARAFEGRPVTMLLAEQATEKNVRQHIANCQYIHLAAHGLVDEQNDNLFGAIALTPPPQGVDSSDDDGFLSLHEIHFLPLKNCQLAVLSACQTNFGPDRPLEAGSSIAQAFLAAGVRRTVCSHWNVDDASTAELIGGCFERIAKAANGSGSAPISYAKALHDARMQVRADPRWASPYYWAPFVLVGPPQ